ncbi:hypothetical protein GCM10028857_13220 [Salinarchaeum chitinilyticum]
MFYMLFAIQFVVVGSEITASEGPILMLIGILASVILFLRECARTLGEALNARR